MVEAIWDSIAEDADLGNQEFSDSQKSVIEKRLSKHEKGEMKYSTWPEVKERIYKRAKDEL